MITSPIALLRAALVAFLALPNFALALSDQEPPTAVIVREDFVPLNDEWQAASGTWSASAGTYNSTAAGTTDLTRIVQYRDIAPGNPPTDTLRFDQYSVSARVRSRGDGVGTVGLIYAYQDSANYYEALLSTDGTVSLRRTRFGSTDRLVSMDLHIKRDVWYLVELRWNKGVNTLSVNGLPVFTDVRQLEFTGGQVGLVTHGVVGQFDKMLVTTPFGDQPFKHDFSTDAPGWTPQSGQWNVANGTYNNAAVQQTSVTLAPIRTGEQVGSDLTTSFTVRARMVNPYANAGNLVGLVFNYAGASYTEVVFSPTGVAKMNLVTNGKVQTLATAPYNGKRNVWFDVTLDSTPSVWVNGERIFDHVQGAHPKLAPEGGVGLITHWAPGKFDDVWFDHDFFRRSCSETFTSGPVPETVSGTWAVNAGTLSATSVNSASIALPCRESDLVKTDFVYSARMLNPYGASGNVVGLIFNYQQPFTAYAGDYYELVFSPNGSGAFLNKFIQGVSYRVGTFPHNVPRNTWFDVQLIRSGIFTTIKVNGVTIARDVPQADLPTGRIGVVTHWAPGRFDDLSLQANFLRGGPVTYTLTHIATPPPNSSNGQFLVFGLNDDGEVAGSRLADGVQQAFIWRAGTFRNLNPLLPSDLRGALARAVNNQHDVIGGYEDQQFQSQPFFLSSSGTLIPLTNLPSGVIDLIDLNDQRQILLSARNGAVRKYFIWRSGQLTALQDFPTGTQMTAIAMNNKGAVVGYGQNTVLWQGGTVMPIPLPEGARASLPAGLNDDDAIAATAYIDDTFPARTATELWHDGEISILMTSDPVLTHTVPHDINNRSVVVGESYNTKGAPTAPTLWDGTRGQDLNALISRQDPLQPFVHLVTPMLINNRGQIVAHGVDSRRTDGRESWYLLTPAAQQ